MTDIADATAVTPADLAAWFKLQARMAKDKATEAMLRSRIAKHYFPEDDRVEGSGNKHPLNDGTGAILQLDQKMYRTVLVPELDVYKTASKEEGSNLPKLPLNKLIVYKPELSVSEYRKLTDEERKACDTFLSIKPGTPSMEIKIPKRAS